MKNLFYLFSEKCFNLVCNVFSASKKRLLAKGILLYCLNLILCLLVPLGNLTLTSCNTTEPPPPDKTKPTLTIELDDVSCIEAWLQLKTKDLDLPAELTLKQYNPTGDSLSHIFVLNTQDSLLYIDSLLPNQNYSFRVTSSQYQVSSIQQPVITMDTTSHNFTFQSWTFGTVGSSTLYDVAIINENNIWAVGEIMIADTSQNGYTTYNAVHWDGNEWELKKIPFIYNGQTFYSTIKAIFAFNENDIWFGIANLIHWNGTTYQSISTSSVFPALVNKMWGSSSNNFYIVGTNGKIAHYNGTNWQRIESGTDLEFLDIYGAIEPRTNEQKILAVCTRNYPLDKAIFKIEGTAATQISSSPIQWELFSCWFIPNKQYYVVGGGIYEKTNLSINKWIDNGFNITHYATTKIRGNDINDVFAVGAFGEILHFNGFSWKSYLSELGIFSGSYGSLDIKENLVAITGFESAKAKITIGHR